MKAVIFLDNEDVQDFLRQWSWEHQGYYGKPCGARVAPPKTPQLEGFGQLWCGINWSDDLTRVAWVRSSGTVAVIDVTTNELFVSGTRHSVRELTGDLTGRKYHITKSLRPDLPPWVVTTE